MLPIQMWVQIKYYILEWDEGEMLMCYKITTKIKIKLIESLKLKTKARLEIL